MKTDKEIRDTVNRNTNEVLSIKTTNSRIKLLVLTIGTNTNIWEDDLILRRAERVIAGTIHFNISLKELSNLPKCKILQGK